VKSTPVKKSRHSEEKNPTLKTIEKPSKLLEDKNLMLNQRSPRNSPKSPRRSTVHEEVSPKSPRRNNEDSNTPKSPRRNNEDKNSPKLSTPKIEEKIPQKLPRKTITDYNLLGNPKSPVGISQTLREKSPRKDSSRILPKDDKGNSRSLSTRRLRTRSELEPVDRESTFTRTSTKDVGKSPRQRTLSRITRLSIRTVASDEKKKKNRKREQF